MPLVSKESSIFIEEPTIFSAGSNALEGLSPVSGMHAEDIVMSNGT